MKKFNLIVESFLLMNLEKKESTDEKTHKKETLKRGQNKLNIKREKKKRFLFFFSGWLFRILLKAVFAVFFCVFLLNSASSRRHAWMMFEGLKIMVIINRLVEGLFENGMKKQWKGLQGWTNMDNILSNKKRIGRELSNFYLEPSNECSTQSKLPSLFLGGLITTIHRQSFRFLKLNPWSFDFNFYFVTPKQPRSDLFLKLLWRFIVWPWDEW